MLTPVPTSMFPHPQPFSPMAILACLHLFCYDIYTNQHRFSEIPYTPKTSETTRQTQEQPFLFTYELCAPCASRRKPNGMKWNQDIISRRLAMPHFAHPADIALTFFPLQIINTPNRTRPFTPCAYVQQTPSSLSSSLLTPRTHHTSTAVE